MIRINRFLNAFAALMMFGLFAFSIESTQANDPPTTGHKGAEAIPNNLQSDQSNDSAAKLKSDKAIKTILEKSRKQNKFPGAVAAIAKVGQPIRIAATGVRKFGDDTPMTIEDQIHLGSCTKAITAAMIARLIHQGDLTWETTIGEAMPRLAKKIHADYHDVTIDELVTHRGGLEANAKDWWLKKGSTITKKRESILLDSLAEAPENRRGKYLYSNLGYMTAGLIAAKTKKKSWESLIRSEVFKPLGITTGGFGAQGKKGKVDQPWGHLQSGPSKFNPLQHDNSPALGPAGTVHMSLADWAKFCLEQTRSEDTEFLKAAMRTQLQTPPNGADYAKGWMVLERPWGKGKVLTHSGSNTMWLATVWIAPNTDTAYLVATNVAAEGTAGALDGIIGELIRLDTESK